jgi:splicing factor 3B subunit 3
VNGTLVLSISETIEVQDTGFLSATPMLVVQQIGSNALLQVHPQAICHVLANRRINEWKVPQGKTIVTSTTAMTMVDYNTIAAGDRFGNVFINCLDPKVSVQVDDDPTGAGSILHEKGILMCAPHETKLLAHFHIGDLIIYFL